MMQKKLFIGMSLFLFAVIAFNAAFPANASLAYTYTREDVTTAGASDYSCVALVANGTDYTAFYTFGYDLYVKTRHNGVWGVEQKICDGANSTYTFKDTAALYNGTHFLVTCRIALASNNNDFLYLETKAFCGNITYASFTELIDGVASSIDASYLQIAYAAPMVYISFVDYNKTGLNADGYMNYLVWKNGSVWSNVLAPVMIGAPLNYQSRCVDLFYSPADTKYYALISYYGDTNNSNDAGLIYSTATPQNSTSWINNTAFSNIYKGASAIAYGGQFSEYNGQLRCIYAPYLGSTGSPLGNLTLAVEDTTNGGWKAYREKVTDTVDLYDQMGLCTAADGTPVVLGLADVGTGFNYVVFFTATGTDVPFMPAELILPALAISMIAMFLIIRRKD
jgi:hypothetical protein